MDDEEVHTDYDVLLGHNVDSQDAEEEETSPHHDINKAWDGSLFHQLVLGNGKAATQRPQRQSHFSSLDLDDSNPNETIYTILYMSQPRTWAFFFAFVVFLLQLTLVLLVLFYTLDLKSEDKKLKVPPNVSDAVHIGQALILFCAVAFQQDLVEAATKWHNGPNREFINDVNTGATMTSFHGSILAQMVTGSAVLFTIFVLTMQAETVVNMMSNFAALHFLSELDDLAFRLGKGGFVHNAIEKEIFRIVSYKVLDRTRINSKIWLRFVFWSIVVVLLLGYGYLKHKQARGNWLCDGVYVQFGDAFNPELAHFSGIYTPQDNYTFETRDYADDLTGGHILLAYCGKEQRWTFSNMTEDGVDNEDACGSRFAQSPTTTSFDVLTTATAGWTVRKTGSSVFVPFDSFLLTCMDEDTNINTTDDLLNSLSDLESTPCEDLEIDQRTEEFLPVDNNPLASNLRLLKTENGTLPTEYGFPMYFSDDVVPFKCIFFTGRRWALVQSSSLNGAVAENMDAIELACGQAFAFCPDSSSLLHNFIIANHTFRGEFLNRSFSWEPLFLSDPVDFGSPSFRSAPVGLHWYPVTKDETGNGGQYYSPDVLQTPPSARFLCIECSTDGDCQNNATCSNNTKRCECTEDYAGGICEQYVACYDQEFPCYDRGFCDSIDGHCHCVPPFTGQLCETNYVCSENGGLCYNGGNCTDDLDCECVDSSTFGVLCEVRSDCTVAGCSNGGSCEETGECNCSAGFSGLLCDTVLEESCDQSLCRNSTNCRSVFNATSCVPYGLAVYDSEDWANVRCNTNEDCFNGGVCQASGECGCNYPFSGGNCGFINSIHESIGIESCDHTIRPR